MSNARFVTVPTPSAGHRMDSKNQNRAGEYWTWSPELKIIFVFCANVKISVLTRRIMNGERNRINDRRMENLPF
jgi:hypothetical protein